VLEAQLQSAVLDVAERYGFLVYHTHDSRRSQPGFPDLTMVKGRRVLFVELKQSGKYPTPEQRKWLRALYQAGQEVGLWYPQDLQGNVVRVLGPRQDALVLPVRYRDDTPKKDSG
jgi:hypothetical protein